MHNWSLTRSPGPVDAPPVSQSPVFGITPSGVVQAPPRPLPRWRGVSLRHDCPMEDRDNIRASAGDLVIPDGRARSGRLPGDPPVTGIAEPLTGRRVLARDQTPL